MNIILICYVPPYFDEDECEDEIREYEICKKCIYNCHYNEPEDDGSCILFRDENEFLIKKNNN